MRLPFLAAPSLAVLGLGLLCASVRAQHVESEPASCCADEHVQLDPLPADATEKEKWLHRLFDERDTHPENVYLSDRYLAPFRERLAALPKDAPLTDAFALRWSLSLGLVRTGELDEAIDLCGQCVALCDANPEATKGWLPEVLFRLAAAHFRLAEKNNCIARHTAESCIFPLQGSAVHVDRRGAEAAREVLLRLLRTEGSDLRLESIWLLNLAHMALGSWPDAVPSEFRLPKEALRPEVTMPRFHDRARTIGLAPHTRAGSVVVDDFTGDGRLDVLSCSIDLDRPVRLAQNQGDGSFVDATATAGLSRQLGGSAMVQGDVDGDGRLDVFVVRGGGMYAGCEFPCSLLRQDAPGHFVDVTKDAGLEIAGPSRSAAFADVDRDGDLDLFVGYESEPGPQGLRFPSRLWQNDGTGHFVDATQKAGIRNDARVIGAVFGDADGDGDMDLFVSNLLAENKLFVNRGDGTFSEEAGARGVAKPEASGPCGWLDFDGDGDLDLLVTYQHHYRPIRSVAAFYLEGRVEDDVQRLYENDGTGHFVDAAEKRGMRRVLLATGLGFGDLDADGTTDVYVATGAHDLAALFPNVLLMGGERFRDATFAAGVGHLQKGNGVAMGDLDEDGDLDLVCQVGGYYQDDSFGDVCFENPGHGRHWLGVQLEGTKDNRFGVGARIAVVVEGEGGVERKVFGWVGVGASLGCGPLRVFLGLGTAEKVKRVEVVWPVEGMVQVVEGVGVDRWVRVKQGVGVVGG